MVVAAGGGAGLFTQSNPEDRRVVPDDPNGRETFKVVYVVLESQYQSSLTAACKRINAGQVQANRATKLVTVCRVLLRSVQRLAMHPMRRPLRFLA